MESKRQLKKLIISTYDSIYNPYYSGGGAVCVQEIYKRLKKEYSVKVIAGTFPNAGKDLPANSDYSFAGSSLLGPVLGHLIFQFAVILRSMSAEYDLWIECSTPPFTFSLLPLFARGKVVSWVHMFAGGEMMRKYKIPFHLIESNLVKNYKYFIVLSKWMKDKILKQYGVIHAGVVIIPNGTEVKRKIVVKENNYFLFLGRIEIEQKGLDLLIDAFAKLPRKVGVKLIIAGGGSKQALINLNKMISKYKVEDKVKIVGRIGGDKKEKLLSECLALVLPSRFDTYPLVALEAFSYAKPIILFDLPELGWIPKNISIKVKPFDVNLYSKALYKIVKSPNMRSNMGLKSHNFVQNYSWDNVYKKFNKFIQTI